MRFRPNVLVTLVWCLTSCTLDLAVCDANAKNDSASVFTNSNANVSGAAVAVTATATTFASSDAIAEIDSHEEGASVAGVYEVTETESDDGDQIVKSRLLDTVLAKSAEHARSGSTHGNADDDGSAPSKPPTIGDGGNGDEDLSDLLKPDAEDRAVLAKKSNHVQKVAKKKAATENGTNALAENRRVDDVGSEMAANFSRRTSVEYDEQSEVLWLKRLFDVFSWDVRRLAANGMVSDLCNRRMSQYLQGLRNGLEWANKMADSTGKYSSQFFFGNDFWLGSRTECRELRNNGFNPIVPPFPVHFYVSRFVLQSRRNNSVATSSHNRMLTIGLCLPKECSTADVKTMLEEDAKAAVSESPKHNVKVINVRAVPGQYSIAADKKLHLLFAIVAAVIVLTVIGTCYEISFDRRRRNRARYGKHSVSVIGNNNENDVKIISSTENATTIELKLDNDYGCSRSIVESSTSSSTPPPYHRHEMDGQSTVGQFISSFSALSNSKKILQVGSAPEDSLNCVHGLRFLSLAWVIMVHTYLQVFTIAENKSLRTLAERNFMFQTVSNATFSVDTFFFISGLLVTYLYFKSARNSKTGDQGRRSKNADVCFIDVKKFFKLVGYRFLRLTPAYMFVLLIAEVSMRWIHNWSVFEPVSQNHVSCDKYWWRNILYINSLYPMKDMCMLWSWYVSNDTQFYVLGILILLISVRYFRLSIFLLFFSLFASWAVTISISLYYDYRAKIEDPFLLFDELYDKPWTRLGPYLIGMFAGWFIFKTQFRLRVSRITAAIAWICSVLTLFSLVYGLHVFPLAATGSALYVSIGHSAWGAALAWIVIACCSGHGGFVNSFLSYELLHPLSRLTYCAYLVHPIIMTTTNFQMDAPLHLQDSIIVILYFGNILASFVASFCISLLFEAPVVRLLKLIFSSPSSQSTKTRTNL